MSHFTDLPGHTQVLSRLIEVCRDTQCAFEMAAGGTTDRLLRAELLQYSGQRSEFVAELVTAAREGTDQVIAPRSFAEPLRRNWTSLEAAVSRGTRAAILAECLRSEAAALDAYRTALGQDLSPPTHALIVTHLAAIGRVHDRIERLRKDAPLDHHNN